ncbi:Putative cytoplasmic protein clustered with trehalase [Actinomycetales bacterium JB111]|nr:Putative cytoplasmic protein clustered with trehalase [Actinomycetales bacterium JB111]
MLTAMRTLSIDEARRIAVRAQLLTAERPTDLVDVVGHLVGVQVDHTIYTAPSAELVAWSRLGAAFTREEFDRALTDRALVEHRGFLRRAEDIALYTAEMAAWPGPDAPEGVQRAADWVDVNDAAREDALQILRSEGPLPPKDIEVEFAVDWTSSGWNNSKNTSMLLERLEERGEVAVSHREGRTRVWDLAERVYPDVAPVPAPEALRVRRERHLAALGIARRIPRSTHISPDLLGPTGVPVAVEGVRGTWQADPVLLESADDDVPARTALLSPLDRLVFDRKRMVDLFGFEYALEMYVPVAKRRWGYFALPVLHGANLVGKVDAETDSFAGLLRVHALHEDEPWSPAVRDGVEAELEDLAWALGVRVHHETPDDGAP